MAKPKKTIITLELPLSIRNYDGKELASIYESEGKFYWHHQGLGRLGRAGGDSYEFQDCLRDFINAVHQEYVETKRDSEEYGKLRESLRTALGTPWNDL